MPLFGLVSSATATSLKSSVSGFGDKVDNMFDFSSPDGKGVSAQNADPQNTILGTYDNPNSRSRALLVGSPLTNVVVGGKESYYKQEAESVIYYKRGKDGKDTKEEITDGKHAYSTFNKYSLVNYRGSFFTPGGSAKSKGVDAIEYNKIDERTLDNPTVSKIVEVTKNNAAGSSGYGYMYNYADFAMCRYNGKIPNNYLLTLRRFPYPVQDDIITPMDIDKDGKVRETDQPDIARAVTWMSEATGNSMSDIIKWSHGYNWKDESASMQTVQSNNSSRRGAFGQFLDSSVIGTAAANAAAGVDGITAQRKKNGGSGFDAMATTYPNHVFGPVNVIKDVSFREQGLTFSQEFKLKFEYELRSFGGANPKVLMLDQLANIMVLTSSQAPFWGGSVRYVGNGSAGKPLGDLSLIKSGNYSGFIKSVASGLGDMFKGVANDIKGLANGKDSKFLNNILGGTLMKMFNSPSGGQAAASLLTGDPTGSWHLTVGNPLNPIMLVGNLTCRETNVTFEGGMGVQDFPERMVVEITLKPGRGRDKLDIESMFNMGRGRFYLQPEEGVDINKTYIETAYGGKDKRKSLNREFRKIANG
tara:strand:- start:7718 stop:9478 length:1761 start_codon:yes stop_codon:yes gene_type:complete